jgi:hypothetical protein
MSGCDIPIAGAPDDTAQLARTNRAGKIRRVRQNTLSRRNRRLSHRIPCQSDLQLSPAQGSPVAVIEILARVRENTWSRRRRRVSRCPPSEPDLQLSPHPALHLWSLNRKASIRQCSAMQVQVAGFTEHQCSAFTLNHQLFPFCIPSGRLLPFGLVGSLRIYVLRTGTGR